jgi:hypothetical protein
MKNSTYFIKSKCPQGREESAGLRTATSTQLNCTISLVISPRGAGWPNYSQALDAIELYLYLLRYPLKEALF